MNHLRRWGAVYILLILFISSWTGQLIWTAVEMRDDAYAHGIDWRFVDVIPHFAASTFENWQSEWLQLIVQATLLLGLKHVWFRADAEDMEQVQADLAEIKSKLGIQNLDSDGENPS